MKSVLNSYAEATGQFINPLKCSLFFGSCCPQQIQEEVRSILGVTSLYFKEKYLGLPTPDGRMSHGKFQNLQARLAKRMLVWDDGLLSQPAREVLINSIAQALPTYIMGVFKFRFLM